MKIYARLFLILLGFGLLLPASLQAQNDDALSQLQLATMVEAEVRGSITYDMAGMGIESGDERTTGPGYEQVQTPMDSLLIWNGTQFSLAFTYPYTNEFNDNCLQTFSLQGEMSTDGLAVQWLTSAIETTCDSPDTRSQASMQLQGPIPFTQLFKWGDYGMKQYCAEFQLEGEAVETAVTDLSRFQVDPLGSLTFVDIDYQQQPQLLVRFCGPQPIDIQESAPPPATTVVWELIGVDGWGEGDVDDPVSFMPGDPNLPDLPGNTAVTCHLNDISDLQSVNTFTAPPQFLYVGQEMRFDLGALITYYGVEAASPDAYAMTTLWLDGDGRPATIADGTNLGGTPPVTVGEAPPGDPCDGFDLTCAIGNSTVAQVAWTVPGGNPGDQLALAYTGEGSVCTAAILYYYELRTYTQTPEPPLVAGGDESAIPADDDNEGDGVCSNPFDPDCVISVEGDYTGGDIADILASLPAGFGDIGGIPGPETLAQALAGVVTPAVLIALISALSQMGGSQPGGQPPADNSRPPSGGRTEMTVTDSLGRSFTYAWNPDYGGYINPQTGGMFDPSLWAEYNQNLAGDQAFIAQQRENMNKITPRTPEQEFNAALAMAQKLIARIPYKEGDPLQRQLDAIVHGVQSQGTIAAVRGIAQEAWGHYQDRQGVVWQEQMDLERQLGYVQTGLQVAATVGKISGSIAEGMLGGSGFVTGFVYGAAENWDKGASSMVANGLIGGASGWVGNRLGNVSPDGVLWNTFTGGLSGAAETAVSDYYNTGTVDPDKMIFSAGVGAAGGAFGAGLQRWHGGGRAAPDVPEVDVNLPGARSPDARPFLAPDPIPPSRAIPLSQQPPAVRKMFGNVEFGPDGKPYAQLSDVLALQSSSTNMRSLKNAPPEVREAFNNTLRKAVYEPHDAELVDWISKNVPEVGNRPVRVDDFRTPGAGSSDPRAINTDRDYRVLMQNEKEEWIEVRKELWQGKSYELFGKQTGFDGTAVQQAHPEIEWNRMTPQQRAAKQQELWADQHQQLATDRASIEASPDYSDQAALGKEWAQVESNILKVKHGEATLQDPDAIGQMYYEKVSASLRRDNVPEAVAQAQKSVDSLWAVRRGYGTQNLPTGHLPDNLNRAMHIIKNTPVDHRATPEAMAAMNQQLADLGFSGGVDQVAQAMSAQFSALKMAGGKP